MVGNCVSVGREPSCCIDIHTFIVYSVFRVDRFKFSECVGQAENVTTTILAAQIRNPWGKADESRGNQLSRPNGKGFFSECKSIEREKWIDEEGKEKKWVKYTPTKMDLRVDGIFWVPLDLLIPSIATVNR